ncbi:DDE superfamily endonuclease [Popillia japonica]|uniref:DDE superfamily endonuclease n=1 Tax=Popillia japonica TaxID=7064 RepID=A0AAW1HWD8_POPJA
MFTFSADGETCVPMVIYPYQRVPEKIVKSINPKWSVGRSGWMTSETFYQYIANVLYPHLVEKNTKFPVILFLDGHKSHLNYQLSLLCSELQVEIISLYPNATRILQPCDVAVFRPLKETWRQCVRQWEEEHPDEILNKVMFAPLLEKAVNVGVKRNTLFNGFKEEEREKEEQIKENKVQIIQNIVIRSPNANIRVSTASTSKETTQSLYFKPNDNKIIINDNLLGPFLASPSAPVRKGKRNVEPFPFAITSERYQEMFRKKQALKEEQENEKEARKSSKASENFDTDGYDSEELDRLYNEAQKMKC